MYSIAGKTNEVVYTGSSNQPNEMLHHGYMTFYEKKGLVRGGVKDKVGRSFPIYHDKCGYMHLKMLS